MVIDKICKMTVEGVNSKSESLFSISHGVWSYGGKLWGGADSALPDPDRVKKLMSDLKKYALLFEPQQAVFCKVSYVI